MKTQTKQHGFTLIELVLYVALAALLLLGVTSFFQVIKQIDLKNQSVSAVEEQGAFAADRISELIRSAAGACLPAAGESGAVLDLDSDCGEHTGSERRISLSGGGQLMLATGGGAAVPLTDSRTYISSLAFTNTTDLVSGPASVTYSFTMRAKSYGATSEYHYEKIFTGGGTVRVN